jgi:hydrogenase maturation protease
VKRILIAGIGNIFFGDDAFGVEVTSELLKRSLPPQVQVIDFGIRSYDLAYALSGDYDAVILVDAAPRGRSPGTLYLIELDLGQFSELERPPVNPHSLDPVQVLQLAESFGELRSALYLLGCEPAVLDSPDDRGGLSAPVQAAVPKAIEMIETLVTDLLRSETKIRSGLASV